MLVCRLAWNHPLTIAEALEQLSDVHREALLLTSWEGLSSADAAAVMACSVSAFKVRLMRARRRLAAALRTSTSPTRRSPPVAAGSTAATSHDISEQMR